MNTALFITFLILSAILGAALVAILTWKSYRRRFRFAEHGLLSQLLDLAAKPLHLFLTCGLIVLQTLGLALLFHLPLKSENSAYNKAPVLWWLAFFTDATGWLITGWVAIKRLYWFLYDVIYYHTTWLDHTIHHDTTIEEIPRLVPLSRADLACLPIVAYLPDPEEPAPVPSIYSHSTIGRTPSAQEHEYPPLERSSSGSSTQRSHSSVRASRRNNRVSSRSAEAVEEVYVLPGQAELSRLHLPTLVLPADQAACGICQSSFKAPRDIPGQAMYEVTRLRRLPCNHCFHAECIDEWLLDCSCACPYCNANVRDVLEQKAEGLIGGSSSYV